MLVITIPETERFDEAKNMFITTKAQTLQLEHSLVSLSKWESKWCKPFLTKDKKTTEEILDYIRCMTITQNVDPNIYNSMSSDVLNKIVEYIESPMTATTINDHRKGGSSREIVTSELIYYWMVAAQIPFECQKWHLNRLLMLIRICEIKNAPPKKMNKSEILSRNRQLNAERKARLGSSG